MSHSHAGMTESEIAETLIDPYEETPKYGFAAIYFLSAAIVLFGLGNLVHRLRRSARYGHATGQNVLYQKSVAGLRFLGSTQHRLFNCHFPVLGVGLLMLAFTLFILIWSLAVWPYYRSRWSVGSPPLAMRTGFFALGCFPFILAFGAKWNIVSFVTGVPHERLQIFHQWLSHLFLVLSMLHTFPFVVLGLKEIRPNSGGLTQLRFGWENKVYYWSGTAALLVLLWLCVGSLWFIRNRTYEIFKLLHIISAILFSAFFYIHCNKLLGSWDYFYATVAIYGISIVARFAWMFYQNGSRIPRAQVELMPGNMVRITVQCAPHISWRTGQHYFINFTTCSPFESHPFTIANRCNDIPGKDREMVVLVKAYSGVTRKLAKLAERGAGLSVPVLLDGPYGDSHASLSVYDRVLLIGGGSGASFTMTMLEDLLERNKQCKKDGSSIPSSRVHFLWVVSSEEAISWFQARLEGFIREAPGGFLTVEIHVTDTARSSSPISEAEPEKETDKESSTLEILSGRPNIRIAIDEFCTEAGTVGIASCGPDSLTFEVRNTVAQCQLDIARGRRSCTEVYLHSEAYSW